MARAAKGRFKKGEPRAKGAGRRPGVPNKVSRDLKESVLLAAEAVGFDGNGREGLLGYLMWLAIKKPNLYVSLLGRMIPMPQLVKVRHSVDLKKLSLQELEQFEAILTKAQVPIIDIEPTLIDHDEQADPP